MGPSTGQCMSSFSRSESSEYATHSVDGMKNVLWRGIWFVALPALATSLMVRFLLPSVTSTSAFLKPISRIGNTSPVYFGVALFVLLSVVAKYWRYYLPGYRWVTQARNWPKISLSNEQFRILESAANVRHQLMRARAMQLRMRSLSADEDAQLSAHLQQLDAAVEQGNATQAESLDNTIRRIAKRVLSAQRRGEAFVFAIAIGLPASLALLLRAWVFEAYEITSNSMLPTLEQGDRVAVSKVAYRSLLGLLRPQNSAKTPRRGDVIVFDHETDNGPEKLAKRVIGIPGDRITMHGGVPLINGWEVPHCDVGIFMTVGAELEPTAGRLMVEFLEDRAYLTLYTPFAPVFQSLYEVHQNEVFVLGDNRNSSIDSRAWNHGRGAGVATGKIAGKVESYLIGTVHGDTADYGRLLHRLSTDVHIRWVDTSQLAQGVKACLQKKPAQTYPPRADAQST